MDYRPEIRPENISLPEENKNSKLLNIGLEMIFFKSDTKAKATKLKINKWGYIKLKRLPQQRKLLTKRKGYLQSRGKYLHHTSDKEFIATIYKEFIQLNRKKTQIKCRQSLNRPFSKKGTQMAKDEKRSTSLTITEVQIKTMMRCHLTPTRISSIQFRRSVKSNSLRPHEPQHARPPCPSPTAEVYPNPCPLSR